MLKKLNITVSKPSDPLFKIMARINKVSSNSEVITYQDGIYENPYYPFNGDHWSKSMGIKIIDEWVAYGVADNYEQILEHYPFEVNNPKSNYVIILTEVRKDNQPSDGGWRWHKWGEYIGTQNPQYEYLYDEKDIEKVYCYHIYEIE